MDSFEFVLVERGARSGAPLRGTSDQNHIYLLGDGESIEHFGQRVLRRAASIRGIFESESRDLVKVTYLVGGKEAGDWQPRTALLAGLADEMAPGRTIQVNAPASARAELLPCLAALQRRRSDLSWRAVLSSPAPLQRPRLPGPAVEWRSHPNH